MSLASINVRIGADIRGFSTAMQNATRKMKKLGRQMSRTGQNMSRNLSLPLAVLGGLAVKTFADFEQGMAKVEAVSGATSQEFAALEKNAMDLGASTRFTATQVAELQLNYSKLGFSAREIVKVTEATLNLALATGEDLARSAEIAGATLRGFNLEVEETFRVTDVMAASFAASALDLEKFGESMKFVAPIANSTNRTIEETTALLSTMADAGISGSMAGTNLRKIFVELNDKGLTLDEALKKVAESSNSLSTATALVGKRANTALVVLSKNRDKIKELTEEYEDSAGAAAKMAKIMDDTLEGAMFKVKSAVQALGISIGRVLMPMVKKVGNFVINLALKFKDLDDRTKKIILVIAGIVAALGPLLVIMGFMMTTVIPGLIAAWVKLTGLMALNPFTVALMAAVALGVAILALTNRTKDFESATSRMSKANNKAIERMAEEKVKLDTLNAALKVTNKGTKERGRLIEEINEAYGEYLPKLLTDKSSNEDIAAALKLVNEEVEKRIKLEAFREELTKAIREQLQLRIQEVKLLGKIKAAKEKSGLAKFTKDTFSASDSVEQLNNKLAGVRKQLMQAKEPIDVLTTAYQELWIAANKGFVKKKDPEKPDSGEGPEIDILEELGKKISKINAKFEVFGDAGGTIIATVTAMRNAMVDLIDAGVSPLSEAYITLETDANDLVESIKQSTDKFFKQAESIDIASKALGRMEKQLKKTKKAGKDLTRSAGEIKDAFVQAWGKIEEAVTAVLNRISSLVSAIHNKSMTELDNREVAELKTAESIEDNEDGIQAVRDKFAAERATLMQEQAEDQKALALMNAIVSTASGVAAALTIPGVGIALALIVGALGAAEIATIASTPVPQFAKGGLVSAPTLAMVGDNQNARFDPEVIAPLSKLQSMIGGGTQRIEVFGRIKGRDIQIANQRALRDKSRVL